LTIVPELGAADNDDDKVRDVVGIYRVNISHEYDYVVVAFEINTNLEQVRSVVFFGFLCQTNKKIICNVVESGAKHQHHPFFGEK
jgi:hypothetical protein